MTTLDRRRFLAGSAGAGAAALAGTTASASSASAASSSLTVRPLFHHGVASGDPLPHSVVLWTRVTPIPAATPGSGEGPAVRVHWEVATDPSFASILRSGIMRTSAARDHTVKLSASKLPADTWLYYRFRCGSATSPVGRTRTAPAHDAHPERLRMGVVSCSNWQAGYFSAYRHLADRDDLDLVLHLGDYIYEYAPGEYGYGPEDIDIRTHLPRREMVSLSDYRRRHAQYRTDPDLQRLHGRLPWITTWDDHEMTNDQYRRGAENHQPETEGDFKKRRAAARRAYDEWMPIRLGDSADLGDGNRLYRRFRFGRLAELSLLDLRTYRSKQVDQTDSQAISDPDRTILGNRQEEWLIDRLGNAKAQWKLIGNPVMVTPVQMPPLPQATVQRVRKVTGAGDQVDAAAADPQGVPFNSDSWDGYAADRKEVLDYLADHGILDTVFLTGDIHSSWACDIPRDPGTYRANHNSVATELVCTSVTSNNLDDITGDPTGETSRAIEESFKQANPHIKYLEFDEHGYSVLQVTPARVHMDWFKISDRRDRDANSEHMVSYNVPSGQQRIRRAQGPLH